MDIKLKAPHKNQQYTIASLFSGIGGLEVGLHKKGHDTILFCEYDECARSVLSHHFKDTTIHPDVRTLSELPVVDIVTAGFPCQDLSMAGKKIGIHGDNSGLVEHLFRLLKKSNKNPPKWILMENVPYMLSLDSGKAMHFLTSNLETLGYSWAYRVVDARAFGTPQRRPRVVILASKEFDPRDILFGDNSNEQYVNDRNRSVDKNSMYGFYWTEGKRGLGWAVNGVPPIKGGSGLGIPSAPAIWVPKSNFIGTITLDDAEILQGFPEGWTLPALNVVNKEGTRWRLVGNAVCTRVSEWIGERLNNPIKFDTSLQKESRSKKWPKAAWGYQGKKYSVNVSTWPFNIESSLKGQLNNKLKPLSERATKGFLSRAKESKILFPEGFIESMNKHLDTIVKIK